MRMEVSFYSNFQCNTRLLHAAGFFPGKICFGWSSNWRKGFAAATCCSKHQSTEPGQGLCFKQLESGTSTSFTSCCREVLRWLWELVSLSQDHPCQHHPSHQRKSSSETSELQRSKIRTIASKSRSTKKPQNERESEKKTLVKVQCLVWLECRFSWQRIIWWDWEGYYLWQGHSFRTVPLPFWGHLA